MSEDDEKTRYEKASEGIGIAMRVVLGLTIVVTVGLIVWAAVKALGMIP